MKPIKVIAWFNEKGSVEPVKFQFTEVDGDTLAVKVDRIIFHSEAKNIAGNKIYTYRCQSVIKGVEKVYELQFEIKTCAWKLCRI